jgi:uncharacterized membrane protein
MGFIRRAGEGYGRASMATTTSQSDSGQRSSQGTQTGLDENVAAALAYVLGWITGIVMYVVESDNRTVRFHAAQSVVVFGGLFVVSVALSFVQGALSLALSPLGTGGNVALGLLSMVLGLVSAVIGIGGFVLWVYLLVRTYQGGDPRIPVAAGIAENIA